MKNIVITSLTAATAAILCLAAVAFGIIHVQEARWLDGEDPMLAPWEAFSVSELGPFDYGPGFVHDAGIDGNEGEAADEMIKFLINQPALNMVLTVRNGIYEAHSARGSVWFKRYMTPHGYRYQVVDQEGQNPIAEHRADLLNTLREELERGNNPNKYVFRQHESYHDANDPRLSFIEPENSSYPYAYSRIAALFDHPNSPDLAIVYMPYTSYGLVGGHHGELDIISSRAHLVFWGKGINPMRQVITGCARDLDVAPTIAKLLGVQRTIGIDSEGRHSDKVYLKWQEGNVLNPVLSGEKSDHVLLLLTDGINRNVFQTLITQYPSQYPNFSKFFSEGVHYEDGMIVSYPSNTYAIHHTFASGTSPGHHGVIDNVYFDRLAHRPRNMLARELNAEAAFDELKNNETIFEAISRTYGQWRPDYPKGAFTASICEFATRGATHADHASRNPTGKVPFPAKGLTPPPGLPEINACSERTREYQQFELESVSAICHLLTDKVAPTPKFVYWHMHSTDSEGHISGPNDPCTASVLQFQDKLLGIVVQKYRETIGDDLTVVLVADHGMELADATRSQDLIEKLQAAGFKFRLPTHNMIYLLCLDMKASVIHINGHRFVAAKVTEDEFNSPIPNATVSLWINGNNQGKALTNPEGKAFLKVPDNINASTKDIYLAASHPKFHQVVRKIDLTKAIEIQK